MRLRMASLFLPPIENILRRARQGFDMPRAKPDFWARGLETREAAGRRRFWLRGYGQDAKRVLGGAFSRPRAIFLAEENAL